EKDVRRACHDQTAIPRHQPARLQYLWRKDRVLAFVDHPDPRQRLLPRHRIVRVIEHLGDVNAPVLIPPHLNRVRHIRLVQEQLGVKILAEFHRLERLLRCLRRLIRMLLAAGGQQEQNRYDENVHDLSYFRANLDFISQRLATRGFTLNLDDFRSLDADRRAALTEAETLKAQRNTESMEIAKLKKAGADTTEQQQRVRAIGDRIAELDETAKALDEKFREILAGIPNIPHESVPVGKSEHDNVEVRRNGKPFEYSFEPKPH